MPKKADPDRERAFKIYKEHQGNIDLIEIAKQLNRPPGTIRGWKNKDNWDGQLNGTFQKNTERFKKRKTFREKLSKEDIDDELTEKQRLFCLYYIKSFNATMAAIKAGYEPSRAHVTGSELVRNRKVAAEIRRLKGQMQEELFVDAMDVLNRYIKIAFADMTDFVEFRQEEVPVMGPFGPLLVKDPETGEEKTLTKMVNVVKFKDSIQVDGGLICQIKQGKDGTSIKLEDRQKALDKLALYFDLFPDKFQRRIEEERLKLNRLKVTGEGQGSAQDGIDSFIKATTMNPEEIMAIFESESDDNEDIQEED